MGIKFNAMDKTVLQTNELVIKMVLSAWKTQNDRFTKLVDKLSDKRLASDIAPGKNSGTYLLGHLTAVHDNMLPLLGLGDKRYPDLDKIFVSSPDKAHPQPAVSDLRKFWSEVTSTLNRHFETVSTEDWFNRHNAVSDGDFAKEPHRNKLNLLINRTNHLSYHYGQLILLDKGKDSE
jgi:hypothetical protein